ncbi:MAG TPA: hypothetical protein VLX92_02935 [Kofleriaceae bacterium]|nr:hypothetical protein [Kofleriaceae bacterium]
MKRLGLFLALILAVATGCGSSSNAPKDAPVMPPSDGGVDASCFTNPTTNYEIINACTNAQKIYKPGMPPLEGSDGTLPPLP